MEPWDKLPTEVACEIISRITWLDELEQTRRVSHDFDRLVQLCTREVDHDDEIILPLSYFTNFVNLQVVGDNILLEAEPAVVQTIPSLRSANFYIGDFTPENIFEASNIIVTLLRQLQLERKLPQVNFRFVGMYRSVRGLFSGIGLIIQGNRFMTINLEPEIMQVFPQIQHIVLPENPWFIGKRLINRRLREFLRVGNFGLLDPGLPPSDENPPLSNYTRRLGESGLVSPDLLSTIFKIYFMIHYLTNGMFLFPDDLLDRLFGQDFIRYNQRLAPDQAPVDPDNFLFPDLVRIIMYTNNVDSIEDITDFDLPAPLSDDEYTTIEQVIRTAEQNIANQ